MIRQFTLQKCEKSMDFLHGKYKLRFAIAERLKKTNKRYLAAGSYFLTAGSCRFDRNGFL